jgi:hypothetical protein
MWTPIPAQTYYTVTVTSMMVGDQRLDLDCGAYNAPAKSIVDSGTTVLNLPQSVFDATVALLVEPLMNATGASADEVNAFLQGSSNLDVPQWRFVHTCSNSDDDGGGGGGGGGSGGGSGGGDGGKANIGLHCYDNAACDLCLNITAYNIAMEAVSQLPSISIGLQAENSSDYEFFVHVPPMQ